MFGLIISRGDKRGRVFRLEDGTNLIGRWDPEAGAFPEIDLEDEDFEAKVSRKHAVVECNEEKITIQDIGSLNGTFLGRGEKLEPGKTYILELGDEVIIGKIFLRLEDLQAMQETLGADSESVER